MRNLSAAALAAILMTLGLVACGEDGKNSNGPVDQTEACIMAGECFPGDDVEECVGGMLEMRDGRTACHRSDSVVVAPNGECPDEMRRAPNQEKSDSTEVICLGAAVDDGMMDPPPPDDDPPPDGGAGGAGGDGGSGGEGGAGGDPGAGGAGGAGGEGGTEPPEPSACEVLDELVSSHTSWLCTDFVTPLDLEVDFYEETCFLVDGDGFDVPMEYISTGDNMIVIDTGDDYLECTPSD